jgi:hypothetical protein
MQFLIGEERGARITSYGEGNIFIFAEISLLKIPSCFMANYKINY